MASTNNTKQAAWIAIGSLFSFGFTIVSSMILSRYFSKADYGTYKQVLYVYHTMLTVFTLGLPKAYSYFLPRVEINQAKSLIRKLTRLFFGLGLVFTIVLFTGAGLIADILRNPDLKDAIQLFSVVPLFTLPSMGLEGILSTYRKTQFMTLYTIGTRMMMLLCVAFPVVFWGLGYMEAIMGFVVSSAIACILALLLKYYPVRNAGNEKTDVTVGEIFRFSMPLLYASLWGMLIHQCDQFFISRYFGNEVFAEFSNGSMELPFVGMIVGACAAVLSPIFSHMSHEQVDFQKEVLPLWMSVFDKTVKLIYPLVLFCLFFADEIMVLLYGNQYEYSAIYFRIKLIANFFTVISFAPMVINTGNVKYYQNVHMFGAAILIVMEYVSILLFNSPYIITIVSVVCHIGRIYCMLRLCAKLFGVGVIKIFPVKSIFKIVLSSVIILAFIRFLLQSDLLPTMSPLLVCLLSFTLYSALYMIYCLKSGVDYQSIIKPLIHK